jgi:hypothetical protein
MFFGGKTKMERKLLLCCLALLMLGGFCYAGTTPLPKHTGVTGTHYYINAPNAQGLNGEGDSALEQYLSTEFVAGDLIVGINIESHDFNGGVAGFTYKAIEMRFENPATPGCPDWTIGGLLSSVVPVPYISNYASLHQYPMAAPVPYPLGFNTVCTTQYNPGQNILTTGCPLIAGDGGPGSGFGYFWDALLGSCAGPMGLDWCFCYYGNIVPPSVFPALTFTNQTFQTDSDTVAMSSHAGFRMVVQLNNTGPLFAGNFSLYARAGMAIYSGFAGTGIDMLAAVSGGGFSSPTALLVPPGGIGPVPVTLSGFMGPLLDYGFAGYTFESILSGGSPFILTSDLDDGQFCPTGCEDDNSAETYYYVQSPQQWGDGMCKRWAPDLLPFAVSSTIQAVDWPPGDFGGAGSPCYKCEIRLEGTFGNGTPDLSPAGLLGTFDPSSVPPGTLYRAQAYDINGLPGIVLPITPSNDIYARCLYNPNYFLIAVGSSTSGVNHKVFQDTTYSLGTGLPGPPNGPDGETLPFNTFGVSLCIRAVTSVPAGDDFAGDGSVAAIAPTIAALK